jgi:hypothetical protein
MVRAATNPSFEVASQPEVPLTHPEDDEANMRPIPVTNSCSQDSSPSDHGRSEQWSVDAEARATNLQVLRIRQHRRRSR